MKYTILMVLVSFSLGCPRIVPEQEAAAFARLEQKKAWYTDTVDQALVLETDVGTLVLQLLPLAGHAPVDYLKKLVANKFYQGLRFHRALHEPIPFGLQIGDPVTRGRPGVDFVWAEQSTGQTGLPIAGFTGAAESITSQVSSLPYLFGAVSLTGKEGMGELGSHLFFHLADNSFLDNSYPVVGFVRYGVSSLAKIRQGSIVNAVYRAGWDSFAAALTNDSQPLPDSYSRLIRENRPGRDAHK